MKKVLVLSDFAVSTGFARVMENIVGELNKTGLYNFDIVARNYWGDPHNFPYKIYPASRNKRNEDDNGLQRSLDFLSTGEYDILFSVQDAFVIIQMMPYIKKIQNMLRQKKQKVFKFIYYIPVDGWQPENWVKDCISKADIPVMYTEYGKKECQKIDPNLNPEVIYHGVNTKDFFPYTEEQRKEFRHKYLLGNADNKYLIVNVNRNWLRKDIPRTLKVFKKFKEIRPDSYLYLHMKNNDLFCNIVDVAKQFGLLLGKDFTLPVGPDGSPNTYSESNGVPLMYLNGIYNMADVVISTAMGEGWGLSSIEAMATNTPIIMPNNTSFPEICDYNKRCLLSKCGGGNNWACFGDVDWNRIRPVVDVDSFVNNLEFAYNHREEMKKGAERAYNWVINDLTWEKVCIKWKELFKKATTESNKVGRNDLCSCGSGKKYKKCCGKV